MPRVHRVGLRTYRLHQLEVIDDGGSGWRLVIYAGRDRRPVARLQNAAATGLAALIAEAQLRVDRLIETPQPTESAVGQELT